MEEKEQWDIESGAATRLSEHSKRKLLTSRAVPGRIISAYWGDPKTQNKARP